MHDIVNWTKLGPPLWVQLSGPFGLGSEVDLKHSQPRLVRLHHAGGHSAGASRDPPRVLWVRFGGMKEDHPCNHCSFPRENDSLGIHSRK